MQDQGPTLPPLPVPQQQQQPQQQEQQHQQQEQQRQQQQQQQQQQQEDAVPVPVPSTLRAKRLQSRMSGAAAGSGSASGTPPSLALSLQVADDLSLGGVEQVVAPVSHPVSSLPTAGQIDGADAASAHQLDRAFQQPGIDSSKFKSLVSASPPPPAVTAAAAAALRATSGVPDRKGGGELMLPTFSSAVGAARAASPDHKLFMSSAAAANAAAEAVLGEGPSPASLDYPAGGGDSERAGPAGLDRGAGAELSWGQCVRGSVASPATAPLTNHSITSASTPATPMWRTAGM